MVQMHMTDLAEEKGSPVKKCTFENDGNLAVLTVSIFPVSLITDFMTVTLSFKKMIGCSFSSGLNLRL